MAQQGDQGLETELKAKSRQPGAGGGASKARKEAKTPPRKKRAAAN